MELAVDHGTPSLSPAPSRIGRSQRPGSPPGSTSGSPSGSQPGSHHGSRDAALHEVLAELGERIKPITLARERTLPVATPFDQLLPDEGLVRGRVLSCRGAADTSLAFGLISQSLVEGAWAAMVDVATLGADAVGEFGIPLERVVRVESGGGGTSWIDVMGAAVDGFDVVVTRVPAELLRDHENRERRPAAVRKLATRVQQKGAVVVVLGDAGALGGDLVFSTERNGWSGVDDGAGHLRSRIIDVEAGGRRLPVARSVSLSIVGDGGRVSCSLATERDPQAELLAEMAGSLDVVDLADGEVDEDVGVLGRRLAG